MIWILVTESGIRLKLVSSTVNLPAKSPCFINKNFLSLIGPTLSDSLITLSFWFAPYFWEYCGFWTTIYLTPSLYTGCP